MDISELITPDRVVAGVRVADKNALLGELARRAAVLTGADGPAILRVLTAREALGSTGIGLGVAMPHATLEGLAKPFTLFVKLARPIDFAAIDGAPVDLVFLMLVPPDAGAEHLAALACASRTLRDVRTRERLRKAKDAASVFEGLTGTRAA